VDLKTQRFDEFSLLTKSQKKNGRSDGPSKPFFSDKMWHVIQTFLHCSLFDSVNLRSFIFLAYYLLYHFFVE